MKRAFQRLGDLVDHAFLDLEAVRESLHQPGQLGEPHRPPGPWDITDGGEALEGGQVVLAGAHKGHLFEDHRAGLQLTRERLQFLPGVHAVPLEALFPEFSHPHGGIAQLRGVGINPETDQQLPHGQGGPLLVH